MKRTSYNAERASALFTEARQRRGWTIAQVADAIDEYALAWAGRRYYLSITGLGNLLRGATKRPHVAGIYLAAKALGLDPEKILPSLKGSPETVRLIRAAVHAGSTFTNTLQILGLKRGNTTAYLRNTVNAESRERLRTALAAYEAAHPYPTQTPVATEPSPVTDTGSIRLQARDPDTDRPVDTAPAPVPSSPPSHPTPPASGLLPEQALRIFSILDTALSELLSLLEVGSVGEDADQVLIRTITQVARAQQQVLAPITKPSPEMMPIPWTTEYKNALAALRFLLNSTFTVVTAPDKLPPTWIASYRSWVQRFSDGALEHRTGGWSPWLAACYATFGSILQSSMERYEAKFPQWNPPPVGPFDLLP